jgi:hypothetical protein
VETPRLLDFIPRLSPEFRSPYHLAEWCECIEGVLDGGVRALCAVTIRHFKSESTYHGIAWLLTKDPTLRILVMVADHEVANDRGKRIRQLCTAAGVGPERGTNVIVSWRNEAGGGVQIMSAKQSKLGQDVDVLIFDDPLSEQDAYDPAVRNEVDLAIAHYTARAGRTGRRGSVLGIMSRWHPDDPIGRRLQRTAVVWRFIHASAIVLNDNGDGTTTERAFAPDVMDLDELHRRRAELKEADPTERIWYAQFQNDPQPDVLGLFRQPRRYQVLPDAAGFRTVLGADLSYSSRRHADYFALIAVKFWPEKRVEDGRIVTKEVGYVVNCWRERWDPAQAKSTFFAAHSLYPGAPIYSYMSGPEIGIVHYLANDGIEVQVIPARFSKRQRAQRTIDRSNAGLLLFPEEAPWVGGLVARLMLFSGDEAAGDDDEIDALVSGVDGAMGSVGATPISLGRSRGGVVVR